MLILVITKVRCCEYSWFTFGNIPVEKIPSSEMLNQVYGFKNVIGNMEKNTYVCITESLCCTVELIQHCKSTLLQKNTLKKCDRCFLLFFEENYISDGVSINLNLSNSEYYKKILNFVNLIMILSGFLVLQVILTISHQFIGHLYFILPGQILFP